MADETPAEPMTAKDVVKRIAAECAFVDANGVVGIRFKPAAAIVRQYADQFRAATPPRQPRRPSVPRTARQPALLLPVSGARAKPKSPDG